MQIQVPNYDIILDFIQLDLIFNKEIIEDKFQHYNASTLGEATQKDKYLHLANDVINNYGNNLNLPLGEFLAGHSARPTIRRLSRSTRAPLLRLIS